MVNPTPAGCGYRRPAPPGRLASTPNLQNIDPHRRRPPHPQGLRGAGGRRLVACDYSQIELRIMAHLSQDEGLLGALPPAPHPPPPRRVFGRRLSDARAARGQGDQLRPDVRDGRVRPGPQPRHRPRREPRITSPPTSHATGVRDFMEHPPAGARAGYVETVFGRRLYLGSSSAATRPSAPAPSAPRSTPMQGTAADIIKRAMVDIDAWLGPGRRHDDPAGATSWCSRSTPASSRPCWPRCRRGCRRRRNCVFRWWSNRAWG